MASHRIGRDDGNKSEGKNSRKEVTSRRVHRIRYVSLEIGRDFAREIYEDSTVVFEVQQARDSVRQRSSNGTCNPSSVRIYPNRLKLPLIHRHIFDVSELLMSTGSGRKRPHTAYGTISYKLG